MLLKEILLKKLDSLLNPKIENRLILSFLGLGTLLVAVPSVMAFTAAISVNNGNTSFTAEINNGPDVFLILLGVYFLAISVLLFVRKQNIELESSTVTDPKLHCQYYICKNFEILSEISGLNLKRFPIANVVLYKNHVFSSLVDIIGRHSFPNRHDRNWGREFKTKEEYLKVYQHPDDASQKETRFPYFNQIRYPDMEEMISLSKKDGIVNAMLEHNLDPSNGIAVVGCYEAGCEGQEWLEEYLLRDVWCVFLSLENISNESLCLNSLEGDVSRFSGFKCFHDSAQTESTSLPKTPIKPGSSVIIPMAVMLPPISPIKIERRSTKPDSIVGDYYQILSECSINTDETSDILVYGGMIKPSRIDYDNQKKIYSQPIHKLDLSNYYEIDMAWGCGSCPHLFFIGSKIEYSRELIPNCENIVGDDSFIVPDGVKKVVIAEIEDEITEFDYIKIDGEVHLSAITLRKGECLTIEVLPGQEFTVVGKYIPFVSVNDNFPAGKTRNHLIYNFIQNHKNGLTNQ